MLISVAHVATWSVLSTEGMLMSVGTEELALLHQQLHSGTWGSMGVGKLACSPLLRAPGGSAGEEGLAFPWGLAIRV